MNQKSGGIGFVGLLTIVLVALKLLGLVDITWWWVFAPVWMAALLVLLVMGVFFLFVVIMSVWEVHANNRAIKKRRR